MSTIKPRERNTYLGRKGQKKTDDRRRQTV